MRLTTFAAPIFAVGFTLALTFGATPGSGPRSGPGLPASELPIASAAVRSVGNTQNPGNAPAQQGQQPQGQQPLKVQVNLVNVFATVRDKHKGIISDLKQDDFKILEDGQEQKVAYFSKDVDLPITLGLLID